MKKSNSTIELSQPREKEGSIKINFKGLRCEEKTSEVDFSIVFNKHCSKYASTLIFQIQGGPKDTYFF